MGVFRWLIGGLAGGIVGSIVWGMVAAAGYEIGWIAWGIGFAVGVGVRYGAYLGDEEESPAQGVVAAAIAIGSIVAAKFAIYCSLMGNVDVDALRAVASEIRVDEEAMIAELADKAVEEFAAKGKPVVWPPGKSYEDARRQADYPADIWIEGQRKWLEFPEPVRKQLIIERVQKVAELQQTLSSAAPGFGSMFSGWDFLWFGLAAMTAFKIGEGSYGGD